MCPRTASTIPLLWSLVSGANPSTILAFPTSAKINDSRFFVALKDHRFEETVEKEVSEDFPRQVFVWLRLTLNHCSDEHVVRASAERQLSCSPSPVSAANFLIGLRRKLDTNCGIAGGSRCATFSLASVGGSRARTARDVFASPESVVK